MNFFVRTGLICLMSSMIIATPENAMERIRCTTDTCFRAIKGNLGQAGRQQALVDCSSFLSSTVTPCPRTTNKIVTVTTTTARRTDVIITTVTTTMTVLRTANVHDNRVNWVSETRTTSGTTTVTVISPTFSAVTTSTSTLTIQGPAGPVTMRQAVNIRLALQSKNVCTAARFPSVLPAYASRSCAGRVAYSSACVCNGVKGTVIVENVATITNTSTRTATANLDVVTTTTSTRSITQVATGLTTATHKATITATHTLRTTIYTTTPVTKPTTKTSTMVPKATVTDSGFTCGLDIGGSVASSFIDPNWRLVHVPNYQNIMFLDNKGYLGDAPPPETSFYNVAGTGHDPIFVFYDANNISVNPPVGNRLLCSIEHPVARRGQLNCFSGGGKQNIFTLCGDDLYLSSSVPPDCLEVKWIAERYW